jgi:hypothetical protein
MGARSTLGLLVCLGPHLVPLAVAQVPAVEELASLWQPVRMCRPLAAAPLTPCDAGGDLDARTCGDYGCCAVPAALHKAGAPICYMPNGESRGSANQTAFGADPWLNDGQAVAAMSQPRALLAVDWTADLLGVECFAAPPLVGNCKSPGGGLLLKHGGPSFASLSVDGAPSAALATGMATQWMPHQIARNATIWRPGGGALRARSEVRTVFGSETVLLRLELTPVAAPATAPPPPLSLQLNLAALIVNGDDEAPGSWGWDVKRPLSTQGFNASVAGGLSLTAHKTSKAFSAAAFGSATSAKPSMALDKAAGYVTASWTALDPTAAVVVELVLAVGTDETAVSATATAIAADFSGAWQAARDDWQSWWASIFDKSVTTLMPFEGQLPVLTTDDAALKRTYYVNVVSLLGNARHIKSGSLPSLANTLWENQTIFATGGPVCAVTEMIIWDTTLNSVLLTLLQPTLYTSYIEKWLTSDVHKHLAVDYISNVGAQKWYAFDDMMVRNTHTRADVQTPSRLADSGLTLCACVGVEWVDVQHIDVSRDGDTCASTRPKRGDRFNTWWQAVLAVDGRDRDLLAESDARLQHPCLRPGHPEPGAGSSGGYCCVRAVQTGRGLLRLRWTDTKRHLVQGPQEHADDHHNHGCTIWGVRPRGLPRRRHQQVVERRHWQ